MSQVMKAGEKRLLASFCLLILITVYIGGVAIVEIQSFSRRMNRLATRNLVLEKAVLEMKVNNAFYAAGIRNYVYWKVSRYLGAVPLAANHDAITAAADAFRRHLHDYSSRAYSRKQSTWSKELSASFDELYGMGSRILTLVDAGSQDNRGGEAVKDLVMVFENRLYKLENFLDNTVRLDNLADIERELAAAEEDREKSLATLAVSLAGAVTIGGLIALSVLRRRIQERAYREKLLGRMINMEEDERKRLSAELHDQMGQELSALKISLGLVEQKMGSQSAEVTEWFGRAKDTAASLIKKSHNIAYLLRPPSLDEVGLQDSIEELLIEYNRLTGVRYEFVKPSSGLSLSPEQDLLFYRLSQELLTNMAKHARAENVRVGFRQRGGSLEFFYEDDGRGFDYNAVVERPQRRKGDSHSLGLLGLKERVELLDGRMTITTAPGKGVKVVVAVGA